jgi:hypothetical protein
MYSSGVWCRRTSCSRGGKLHRNCPLFWSQDRGGHSYCSLVDLALSSRAPTRPFRRSSDAHLPSQLPYIVAHVTWALPARPCNSLELPPPGAVSFLPGTGRQVDRDASLSCSALHWLPTPAPYGFFAACFSPPDHHPQQRLAFPSFYHLPSLFHPILSFSPSCFRSSFFFFTSI